jgi:hypothetical protein
LVLGGCRSGDDVTSRLDDASWKRLEALPADARVVAAVRLAAPTDTLPTFDDDVRMLALTPGGALVELPRSGLARLGEGVGAVSVWGGEIVASKLDPRLRTALLGAWTNEDPAPLEIIARFREDGLEDLRARLEKTGAVVRTVAGPVVTLDASPDTVFELLAWPDLLVLQQPRPLNPLDGP